MPKLAVAGAEVHPDVHALCARRSHPQDIGGANTFECQPATSVTSPCTSCTGMTNQTDGCLWTWTAPGSETAAAAVVAPASSKCRCTDYKPADIKTWLCGSVSSCPNSTLTLDPTASCQGEYPGSRPCFIETNWDKVRRRAAARSLPGLSALRWSRRWCHHRRWWQLVDACLQRCACYLSIAPLPPPHTHARSRMHRSWRCRALLMRAAWC